MAIKEISVNTRNGSFDVEQLKLNIKQNTGLSNKNIRRDFGAFPLELAIKVCDLSQELSASDIEEIKSAVESGDPDNDKTMYGLVRSVMRHSVTEPVSCYAIGNDLIAVKGNHRLTACYIAKRIYNSDCPKAITVIMLSKEQRNPRALLMAQFNENKFRKDLNVLEEAELLGDMRKEFGSIEAVAEETGYSIRKVEELLDVLNLSPEAQLAVKSGTILKNPVLQLQKEIAKEVTNPIQASEIISQAIVEATTEAVESGKNKASLEQAKTKAKEILEAKRKNKSNVDSSTLIPSKTRKLTKKQILAIAPMQLESINWKTVEDSTLVKVAKLLGLDEIDEEFLEDSESDLEDSETDIEEDSEESLDEDSEEFLEDSESDSEEF